MNIDTVNEVSYANIRGIEVALAEIPDTIAPVISLLGADPMTIEAGSTFTDPGAQVTDNVDPTMTIYGVSNVNPNIPVTTASPTTTPMQPVTRPPPWFARSTSLIRRCR